MSEQEYRAMIRKTVEEANRLQRAEDRMRRARRRLRTTWFDVVALGACIGTLAAAALYEGWL